MLQDAVEALSEDLRDVRRAVLDPPLLGKVGTQRGATAEGAGREVQTVRLRKGRTPPRAAAHLLALGLPRRRRLLRALKFIRELASCLLHTGRADSPKAILRAATGETWK